MHWQEYFKNKHVLITGTASGIGQALGDLLSPLAASVDGVDIREAPTRGRLVSHVADVTRTEDCADIVSHMSAQGRPCNLVVACAGVNVVADAKTFTPEQCSHVMNTNYMGTVNIVHAALKGMIERRHGHVVIVSSIAGMKGLPHGTAYGPSKAAQILFAENLRWQLRPYGVHVTLVAPGFVDTPMNAALSQLKTKPFMISAMRAAQSIAIAVARQRRVYVFPRMSWLTVTLGKALPHFIFDRVIFGLHKLFH